jgi:hypothetical protein
MSEMPCGIYCPGDCGYRPDDPDDPCAIVAELPDPTTTTERPAAEAVGSEGERCE